MSDSESENESSSVPTELVGFMFGNIDKHGNLENDVLDEVRIFVLAYEFHEKSMRLTV